MECLFDGVACMTNEELLELATGDISFTDEAGYSYTLTKDEKKMLISAIEKQVQIDPMANAVGGHHELIYPSCKMNYVNGKNYCDNCGQCLNKAEQTGCAPGDIVTKQRVMCSWTKLPCTDCSISGCQFKVYEW